MGYAKYKEDIERTRSQNVFGTWLDFRPLPSPPTRKCPFCCFETNAKEQFEDHLLKAHRDAAIFLEHDDHIMPDRAVFRVRPIHLKVRCPALPDGIDVAVTSKSRPGHKRRFNDGRLVTITPPDEEIVLLMLGIGAFRKDYAISFKKQVFQARLTPYLIEHVGRANANIATWGWPDMAQFERELTNEHGLTGEETRHRLAIYEYYQGLWLEQNRKAEYPRHLEKAFEVLRDFDEPLSLLISSYFLFRVNSFDGVSPSSPFPRLRRVAAFFRNGESGLEGGTSLSPSDAVQEFVPCEIAIADGDAALFEAVSAVLDGMHLEALRICDDAEHRITPGDDQMQSRLWFTRYRIFRDLGRQIEAKFFADRLSHCVVESFRTESIGFLKKI